MPADDEVSTAVASLSVEDIVGMARARGSLPDDVRLALAAHPNKWVRALCGAWVPSDAEVHALVASGPVEDVVALVRSTVPLSDDVLRLLAGHPNPWVRASLGESLRPLPADVLLMFLADREPDVRASLADSPRQLPDDVLRVLARDRDSDVRESLAGSGHRLPDDVVDVLAGDEYTSVQHLLIFSDRDLPEAVMRTLAGSAHAAIRLDVLTSDRVLPVDVLFACVVDVDPGVSGAAVTRVGLPLDPSTWEGLLGEPGTTVLQRAVIAAATYSDAVIEASAGSPDPLVRVGVVWNDYASDVILSALADDPDPRVRAAVGERLVRAAST